MKWFFKLKPTIKKLPSGCMTTEDEDALRKHTGLRLPNAL